MHEKGYIPPGRMLIKVSIEDVISHLKKKPSLLDERLMAPSIKILCSYQKKRYTELHRIKIVNSSVKPQEYAYYWVRIVKNKPEEQIWKALRKQYCILKNAAAWFKSLPNNEVVLSVSKPLTLLDDFNCLITEECPGCLFNHYLKRQIPFLKQKEIFSIFHYCGMWLRAFHECFRVQEEPQLQPFDDKELHGLPWGHYLHKEINFMTLCHNDFSPRNIFTHNNGIEVIDFVGARKGLSLEDVKFFCRFIWRAKFNGLYTKNIKLKMLEQFVLGYRIWNLEHEAPPIG